MTTAATSPTTWDAEILAALTSHVTAEKDLLADYARAAEEVSDPDVRYLLGLILEDEARHHRIFLEMANALRTVRGWQRVEPSVPDRSRGALTADVQELTGRLLAAERADMRELRELRRRLRPVSDTTLWPLLVDLMALDTEKHLRILKAISSRGA